MIPTRLAWIDWMKSLGMLLIVLGHSGAQNYLDPTPPFNFKQLGVAFFVFVMGFSLVNDRRPVGRVLYNRLFEVYLFGGIFALLMSAISWFRIGDLQESNYLPLAAGVNVLFDFFPANPTTWYIGTYLHLLLLWAWPLRRMTVRPWMLAAWWVAEILIRAVLIGTVGPFVAYMLLTNWIGVFLLGMYVGQVQEARATSQTAEPASSGRVLSPIGLAGWIVGLIVWIIVWPLLIRALFSVEHAFPFQSLERFGRVPDLILTSASVSLLYTALTCFAFQIVSRLPRYRVVAFFASNTLIVFIIHMPLIYAITPVLYPWLAPGALRVLANVLLFYVAPAGLSEILRRVTRPASLRDALRTRVHRIVSAGAIV